MTTIPDIRDLLTIFADKEKEFAIEYIGRINGGVTRIYLKYAMEYICTMGAFEKKLHNETAILFGLNTCQSPLLVIEDCISHTVLLNWNKKFNFFTAFIYILRMHTPLKVPLNAC